MASNCEHPNRERHSAAPCFLTPRNGRHTCVFHAKWLASVCFVGLHLFACQGNTGSQLRLQYSRNTNCPLQEVTVDHVAGDRYVATGCDSAAFYRCNSSGCEVDSDSDSDSLESSGKGTKTVLVVPVATKSLGKDSEPRLEKTKSGKSNVVVDIVLESMVSLRLSAVAGEQASGVSLRLAQVDSHQGVSECELALMLNGQKITTSKPKGTRKGSVTSVSVELPAAMVSELGTVRQMALRACDKRFTLSGQQLAKVQQFAEKYTEEVAWNGDAKSGATGGLVAPASGWPEWKVSSPAPAAKVTGAELRGEELFQLLAPSVLRVEALSGGMVSQGSAVAVSQSEVLTNCHVVSGAQKIIARNGKQDWVAKLLRADPATDRCVLTIDGAKLTPVKGVRAHAELKVGEPLYTLGAPSGLDLSLSDGVLAGLREEDGRHFVQTTTPISPGSSGGGLFDKRGNLVGITTLALVGRAGHNQSLNFAIPAEVFFQDKP